MKKICLIGGAGFIGTHLANKLVKEGWWVRILTRRREAHRELLVLPTAEIISADIFDQTRLNRHLADCEVVVNLIGILNESGDDGSGFHRAHVETVERIIEACRANGISRLLHMSALNADAENGSSHYLKSKGKGEDLAHSATDLQVTSFRPSVIFGQGDAFFNRFASLLSLPVLIFPLACPDTRFAPVWVQDVVDAMMHCLAGAQIGQRLNLCGPGEYTLKELVAYTGELINVKRMIIPMNEKWSLTQAKLFDRIPGKPLSLDNYRSLQTDSVCGDCNDFEKLGIHPSAIDAIMPRLLGKASPRAAYDTFRHQARRDT